MNYEGGERMKLKRKMIVLLCGLIVAPIFFGTAVLAPPQPGGPALSGVTRWLASFDGSYVIPAAGRGSVPGAKITTDRLAIFTISVYAWLKESGDNAWISFAPNKWSWAIVEDVEYADYDAKTITIAGYGVDITYLDVGPEDMVVSYSIVVQGEQGTLVTEGEWPT